MSTPAQPRLIPIADLRRVAMECGHCGTQILFDITTAPPSLPAGRTSTPAVCPVCDNHFERDLQRAVDAFRQSFTLGADQKSCILFAVDPAPAATPGAPR